MRQRYEYSALSLLLYRHRVYECILERKQGGVDVGYMLRPAQQHLDVWAFFRQQLANLPDDPSTVEHPPTVLDHYNEDEPLESR